MNRSAPFVVALLLMLAPAMLPVASAQIPGLEPAGPTSGGRLVTMDVGADVGAIRPGEQFHLAVTFQIEPGWHIYWIHAGASGLPTLIEVDAPAGFEIGDVRWPRPRVFHGQEGITFGYEKTAVAFVPVTAPATLNDGRASFDVKASWLVCKVACLMGDAEQAVGVPTLSGTGASVPADASAAERLMPARQRLPRKLSDLTGAELRFDGATLSVSGPAEGFTGGEFFPAPVPGVTYGPARLAVRDGRFRLDVAVELAPLNARGKPMTLRGLIALGSRPDDPSYQFERPVTGEDLTRSGEGPQR